VAAVLARAAGRFGRRAATRGLLSAGTASIAIACLTAFRKRPVADMEVSASVAMAAGASMELPWTSLPLGVLSAGVAVTKIRRNATNRQAVMVATVVGLGAAIGSRRVWPVAPRAAELRPVRATTKSQPSPAGEGLAIVVNQAAGKAPDDDLAGTLGDSLPAARVAELEDGADLETVLRQAAEGALALGVAGGDGSLNTAAGVAHERRIPLMVIPAGTLNHLARDLGLHSTEQAVDAVRNGDLVAMDVGEIDGKLFLNTASIGSYAELVDTRESLEERIGKWPAMLVALARVLRRSRPVRIEIDGEPRSVWMVFVGNCRYHPHGFAPTWRERLDDGLLDVRTVSARHPGSRTRLLFSVLTGRLSRCRVYDERTATTLRVRSLDGPARLARDGETFDGSPEFTVTKRDEPLLVYVPREDHQSSSTFR
jgi:undecaprenyl-diphosphatase